MTDRYAVIGYPLGHTISPAFQQAAFDHLGIDATYEAIETLPNNLDKCIVDLRSGRLTGINVTIPHKTGIVPLLDEITEAGRLTGAVNTVSNTKMGLRGDNTDVVAIKEVLKSSHIPAGIPCLLIGAGGAARATLLALLERGDSITIANRTLSTAERLVNSLCPDSDSATVALSDPTLPIVVRQSQLIVNATSIGMKGGSTSAQSPLPNGCLHRGQVVFDIVYRPARTPLLNQATIAGATCLGGLEMLILQGAHSFQIWTGRNPPLNVMRKAALQAMKAP